MDCKVTLKVLPGLLLGIALAGPAFAQNASQSMRNAGNSAENTVSNAWQGTKTAIKDTDITAKVEMALHNDKMTKGQDIHVSTHGGMVTLMGHAPQTVATQAVRLAHGTTGVMGVNNDIRVRE
ncbi:MAG: BON domain-containing protein [Deltaproteobacteria bacterium]|nr:BON domain-containing protein [Deltaproteobacteria bacterium]